MEKWVQIGDLFRRVKKEPKQRQHEHVSCKENISHVVEVMTDLCLHQVRNFVLSMSRNHIVGGIVGNIFLTTLQRHDATTSVTAKCRDHILRTFGLAPWAVTLSSLSGLTKRAIAAFHKSPFTSSRSDVAQLDAQRQNSLLAQTRVLGKHFPTWTNSLYCPHSIKLICRPPSSRLLERPVGDSTCLIRTLCLLVPPSRPFLLPLLPGIASPFFSIPISLCRLSLHSTPIQLALALENVTNCPPIFMPSFQRRHQTTTTTFLNWVVPNEQGSMGGGTSFGPCPCFSFPFSFVYAGSFRSFAALTLSLWKNTKVRSFVEIAFLPVLPPLHSSFSSSCCCRCTLQRLCCSLLFILVSVVRSSALLLLRSSSPLLVRPFPLRHFFTPSLVVSPVSLLPPPNDLSFGLSFPRSTLRSCLFIRLSPTKFAFIQYPTCVCVDGRVRRSHPCPPFLSSHLPSILPSPSSAHWVAVGVGFLLLPVSSLGPIEIIYPLHEVFEALQLSHVGSASSPTYSPS